MPHTVFIQSKQDRLKAINRFCYAVILASLVYVSLLGVLGHARHALVMSVVSLLFGASVLLNKQERYALSRTSVLFGANFGILYFSLLLGFGAGVHLYLFTTPLICYLLYDFEDRARIAGAIALFLCTFLLILASDRFRLIKPLSLSHDTLTLLYMFNLAFSLSLCLSLIVYFAYSHSRYIRELTEANHMLAEKHEQLLQERSERTGAQEEVRKAVKERDKLLQEVHHRVKNNLAVISGLVELQNFYTRDEKAAEILQQSRNRIKSIAVLHEKLYENKSLERIDIKGYVDELLHFTRLTFAHQKKTIHIHTAIEPLELGLTEALPFSLLLNELLTNSYKHAFRDRGDGHIYLSIGRAGEGEVVFSFRDDGNGFDHANFAKDQSLGMNLVEMFCKQLKGEMQFASAPAAGVEFKLRFRI